MKVNKLDHICIAVKNLEEAKKIWEPILGRSPDDPYTDEYSGIGVARYWVGGVGFELMESLTTDGDVARFIDKHGEGVMLVSLNVDDTRAAKEELEARGYPLHRRPAALPRLRIRVRASEGGEWRAARADRLPVARTRERFLT